VLQLVIKEQLSIAFYQVPSINLFNHKLDIKFDINFKAFKFLEINIERRDLYDMSFKFLQSCEHQLAAVSHRTVIVAA
jgi:hypothetical protein